MKEASHKRLHITWYHLLKFLQQANLQRQRTDSCLELGEVELCWGVIVYGYRFFWGGDENVLKQTMVMVVQFCNYSKNHWIVYFKKISIIEGGLYLNKAVKMYFSSCMTDLFSDRMLFNWKLLTHWKRPWCLEGLGAGGEGDDRGWDGWMVSPTRWARVWVNSRSLWWTGRPGVLRFMGWQRVGHDWATELNGTSLYLSHESETKIVSHSVTSDSLRPHGL